MRYLLKINATNTSVSAEQLTKLNSILPEKAHFLAVSTFAEKNLSQSQAKELSKINTWLTATNKEETSILLLPINLSKEGSAKLAEQQIEKFFAQLHKQWQTILCVPYNEQHNALSVAFTEIDKENQHLIDGGIQELETQAALTMDVFLSNDSKNVIDFHKTILHFIRTEINPRSFFLGKELGELANKLDFSFKNISNPFSQLTENLRALLTQPDVLPVNDDIANVRIKAFNSLQFLANCWNSAKAKAEFVQKSFIENKALVRSTQTLCAVSHVKTSGYQANSPEKTPNKDWLDELTDQDFEEIVKLRTTNKQASADWLDTINFDEITKFQK